ncbi:MAG: DNA replication/repair protein RecF [Prevotellaceae bacterium]|nr:DNA replication/repair protein RecF [Prevotellaceae bacterium]
MILKNISILNYKNIADASLELSPKINCFIGSNGEGKTNILDAVYYMSFCRSTTTNIDSNVIRHGADFFMINAEYMSDSGVREELYAGMKRGVKKQFKRNKKTYKRLSEHIGLVPLIMVSPDDTILIHGGSEERRRFLDMVISQFDSAYIDSLNAYNKALQQRNVLLKQDSEPDATLIELWEMEMAKYGEIIFQKREDFIQNFTPVFQSIYSKISGDHEEVSLKYISHCQRGSLLETIQKSRMKDRILGYSLHGIHRDDLEMMLGGYPLKREGSQGQNKTYVISLKLAQFGFLCSTFNANTPLLLLDDIFDKLDAHRVENIVGLVSGINFGQILITDTNRDHLDQILQNGDFDYKLFHVKGGEIIHSS